MVSLRGEAARLDVLSLYLEFGGSLVRIVGRSVEAPEGVVEDACQAAWMRLLRDPGRLTRAAAYTWLIKTALHEACRLTRRGCRDASLEGEDEESSGISRLTAPGPEVVLARRERLRVVSDLPERQQRLVWLRALGLSYEEIACRERTTSRTVHRQLDRARHRLRLLEAA
jgi:RNA polymerase sigma factor (sigma-70 family)